MHNLQYLGTHNKSSV